MAALGRAWAESPSRPRIEKIVLDGWDALVEAWSSSDLPLVIRKGGDVRGGEIRHDTGRRIVLADNSPAQWAFSRAFAGDLFTVSDIRRLLEQDRIPFAYAIKASDRAKMRYSCTLSAADNVNKRGWKLGHIEDVGLGTRQPISKVPIEELKRHFRNLIRPSNMFLVPLEWAGFGELSEVVEAVRQHDSNTRRGR